MLVRCRSALCTDTYGYLDDSIMSGTNILLAARPHRCIQNVMRDVGMQVMVFYIGKCLVGVESIVRGNHLMDTVCALY
jgi:hypothetical protein